MRYTTSVAVLSLALWICGAASAQSVTTVNEPSPVIAASGSVGTVTSSGYAAPGMAGIGAQGLPGGYIPPYSYYTAPLGVPARPYIGFGETDVFPFHGQPYGYPYDRWTWSGMSGTPSRGLVRYYYPPVP